jgi:predicted GTPase
MVSRVHFLTEFNLYLVDLTIVPKVHKAVQKGLRGIDESLFPIIAPRLLGGGA